MNNTKRKLNLTVDQENMLCEIIGDWYLNWKNRIANYEDKTHRLGYAKEELKFLICAHDEEG